MSKVVVPFKISRFPLIAHKRTHTHQHIHFFFHQDIENAQRYNDLASLFWPYSCIIRSAYPKTSSFRLYIHHHTNAHTITMTIFAYTPNQMTKSLSNQESIFKSLRWTYSVSHINQIAVGTEVTESSYICSELRSKYSWEFRTGKWEVSGEKIDCGPFWAIHQRRLAYPGRGGSRKTGHLLLLYC